MNKIIKYIVFVSVLAFILSCEKDEDKAYLSDNPVLPTLVTIPDLTLTKEKEKDTLVFVATPVNPGFQASVNYIIEASVSTASFSDSVSVATGTNANEIKVAIGKLNTSLKKKFPAGEISSVAFRVRAVLVVDAGTGANKPGWYASEPKSANATLY